MKNFAEQQMGAVLDPYANHPEMNRTMATSAAEMPRDIRDTAKAIAEQPWLTRGERDRMAGQIEQAILAERQRHTSPARRLSLTPRQQDAMDFITAYRKESGGISPSYLEIMGAIGLASKSGVNRIVKGLEERGYIARMPNLARVIQVIE